MKKKTRSKLEYLTVYAKKQLPEWKKQYLDDITGVHIGTREREGKQLRYYCIVFHVLEKKKTPSKVIPRYIQLEIPGEGLKKIPTDVIETGEFELFGIQLGDSIKKKHKRTFGTIGVFLKNQNHTYACSNMHVMAPTLLKQGKNHYHKPPAQQYQTDIRLKNQNGRVHYAFLERAVYDGIDAAIARIQDPRGIENRILNHGISTGYININWINYKKTKVAMQGWISKHKSGTIYDFGVEKYSKLSNVPLTDLVAIRMKCRKGDSGAPIFDRKLRLVGILVGGDSRYSYAIPIEKILSYFHLNLL
ncbi:MAG: hypothetical protein GY757_47875 [bacterium]|nr:hypothetical protein [bacterium]